MKTIKPATASFWHTLSPLARGLMIVTTLFLTSVFILHFYNVYVDAHERTRYRQMVEDNSRKLERVCAYLADKGICKDE